MKKKGRISKLLSVVVSAAMALSCFSGVAFAGNETATTSSEERTFEVFQIFTGSFNDSTMTLGEVKWGFNGKGTTGADVDETTLSSLTALKNSTDDTAKLNVIKQYANLGTDATPFSSTAAFNGVTLASGGNGSYTYEGLPDGYYLIRDQSETQTNGFYTLYVAQVTSGKLVFTVKGNVPTVEKKVSTSATTDFGDETTASYGQTVYFQMTGNVSSRINNFNEYYYKFTDTMCKGLTFTAGSIKVYYNSVEDDNEITTYFFTSAVNDTDTGETSITVSIADLKQLENIKVSSDEGAASKYPLKDKSIIVTYQATLNKDAVLNAANINSVYLNFYNDPNNSGDGNSGAPTTEPQNEPTPEEGIPVGQSVVSTVSVYTTALKITKENAEGNRLTGASFKLEGNGQSQIFTIKDTYRQLNNEEKDAHDGDIYYALKDGTYTTKEPASATDPNYLYTQRYYKLISETSVLTKSDTESTSMVATVGSDGVLTFWGLGEGTYILTEVEAPAGYNKIDPLEIHIEYTTPSGDTTSSKQFVVNNRTDVGSASTYDGILYYTCIDQLGTSLPTTGGIGTAIFYVVGTILVLGAGIALVVRRRMRRETRQL